MRKLKYIINAALAFTVAAGLSSCFEDKGNYDYLDPGTVGIDMTQTEVFQAITEEPFVITPVLSFPDGTGESDFRYEWIINGELYSRERNLTFIGKKTGIHWGTYRVIHKNTDIQKDTYFAISARALYADGWVVLSRKANDESELGMVIAKSIDGETVYTPYYDIYESDDMVPLGMSPVKLISHSPEILVIQRGGRGPAEIDGDLMKPVIFMNEEFINGETPAGFNPIDAYYNIYSNFALSDDGKVYMKYTQNYTNVDHVTPYNNQPMYMDRDAYITHLVKPRPGSWVNHILFYDSHNKRLLCFATDTYTNGSGMVQDIPDQSIEYPASYTKLSDFGDMDYVYIGGGMRQMDLQYVMVVKDASGNHFIQLFGLLHDQATEQFNLRIARERRPLGGGAVMTDKTKFINFHTQDYMFFTAGAKNDQLWFYNYGSESSTPEMLKDYAGDEIVAFATQNITGATQIGLGMKSGDFVMVDIPYGFHTDIQYEEKFRINFGEIVDIAHKPSYFQ